MFPPVRKKERRIEYVRRCMLMSTIAAKIPNRKERKKALEEHFDNLHPKMKHGWLTEDTYMYHLQAARYLGVTPNTLRVWRYRGYINPGSVIIKGRRFPIYQVKVLDQIKKVRDEAFAEKQKSDSN